MPLTPVAAVQSRRLTLRAVAEADLPDLLEINGDPEVTRFLPYDAWQSLDDGIAWLRRMEAGRKAFSRRRDEKSGIYSYEQRASAQLSREDDTAFRRNRKAWKFFESKPPGYRHLMICHVVSAKRPETRRSRLQKLIEASEKGARL